jgi:hypothetical protein
MVIDKRHQGQSDSRPGNNGRFSTELAVGA